MVTSSSPGILSNDHYVITINAEENARIQLTTQGYQRVFTMRAKASQLTNTYLGDNSSFIFLPHPVVPHKASDFLCINNIFLQKNHQLLWSEVITCGRKLNGEIFSFTKFQNVTNIYLNERLAVKENVLMEPLRENLLSIGQMEGYTHQSTFLFIQNDVDTNTLLENCSKFLSAIKNISFGISALPVNGLIFRILGNKGEQLFNCNNHLATMILNCCSYLKPQLL